MKFNKNDVIILLIGITVYSIWFFLNIDTSLNLSVYLTFYLIGLISLSVLLIFPLFISCIKIFYSFVFIFFFFMPLGQYTNEINLWNHTTFSDSDYLTANLFILISILLVLVIYSFKMKNNQYDYSCHGRKGISILTLQIFFLMNIIVLLFSFATGMLDSFTEQTSDTILTALYKTIRFIPVSTLVISIAKHKFDFTISLKNILFLINVAIVVILFFPLSGAVTRFLLFGTYLILLMPILNKIRLKFLLPILLLIGFIIIFPAFNFFKGNSFSDIQNFKFGFDAKYFDSVDFDAYQLFLETIKLTKAEGITFGKNIISAILFFIPRSIWSSKEIMTGSIVASYFGHLFTNLSCPYIAELYYAFGGPGIIIGSILLPFLIVKSDKNLFSENLLKRGVSMIFIGILFYWLRGSLLTTTAFLMSLILSYILVYLVFKLIHNFEKKRRNLSLMIKESFKI